MYHSIIKQLIYGVLAVLILYTLQLLVPQYNWVLNDLAKENIKVAKDFEHLTENQRLQSKIGIAAQYFKTLNDKTHENAVIILPPKHILQEAVNNDNFNKFILEKSWANYFVYPRTLIYEDDKEQYPVKFAQATHVAIFNNWGYHLIPYPLENKPSFAVMELNRNSK